MAFPPNNIGNGCKGKVLFFSSAELSKNILIMMSDTLLYVFSPLHHSFDILAFYLSDDVVDKVSERDRIEDINLKSLL